MKTIEEQANELIREEGYSQGRVHRPRGDNHTQNGVNLRVSSRPDTFHFSLGHIETPTLWGASLTLSSFAANTNNCFYTQKE